MPLAQAKCVPVEYMGDMSLGLMGNESFSASRSWYMVIPQYTQPAVPSATMVRSVMSTHAARERGKLLGGVKQPD